MSTAQDQSGNCPHCGCMHPDMPCPRVKAIEYYPDGRVRRVEYITPKPLDCEGFEHKPWQIGKVTWI